MRIPLLVAAAVSLLAVSARANIVAVYNTHTGSSFDYTLRFTLDQPGEQLRAGDFITIYDVPSISSATAPAGFTISENLLGVTPPGFGAPQVVDNPAIDNVTFTYAGATRTSAFDFVNATIVTNAGITGTAPGRAAGTTSFFVLGDQGSTNVTTVPAVPEPASLTVLAVGGLALLRRRRNV